MTEAAIPSPPVPPKDLVGSEFSSASADAGGSSSPLRSAAPLSGALRSAGNGPGLLQRVADGDRSAMSACLDAYGGMIWSLARRMCPTTADAEDAVQDIVIELWKKAAAFDPRVASEATFVAMIARRRLVDRFRRQSRRPTAESLDAAPEPTANGDSTATAQVETADEAARAAEAMKRLSPPQQQVLRLAIFGGLSYPEIAERTGQPLGTVKTHARRGLIRLRELLQVAVPDEAGLEVRSAAPSSSEGQP